MKKKLKILVLADVPIWTLPGLEQYERSGHYATWLKSLIPAFEKVIDSYEIELHWVVFVKNIQKPLKHHVFGQTFHILPRWKKLASMLTGYWHECKKIQEICDTLNPDLVHAWGSEDVYGLGCSRLIFEGPKIFTLQGCLGEYVRRVGGGIIFRLQAAYENKTIRHFNYASAESPMAAKLLREINPHIEVGIIDYGVDQLFHNTRWTPVLNPEIIFVGAVTERKGLRETIEAFARPELRHVKLHILGEGDLFDELKAVATNNIEWHGKLSREKVSQKLSRAWAFLMPTYSDTGPTVVKEARVVGMPVITTTAAGAASYIKHGESGYIIEPKDADAIVDSVLRVTESLDVCRSMGKCDWSDTKSVLKSSMTAKSFVTLYMELFEREAKKK